MTDEQNERLKQIREGGRTTNAPEIADVLAIKDADIDFLLSLVDSQVKPDCFPDMIAVNKEYAATLMRSACIETVRNHFGWGPHVRPILIEALESTTIQEQEKQSG